MVLPFSVHPYQTQLHPASVDDVLDAEIELAAHDYRVWFTGELVEELDADTVDFVVRV